VIRLPHGVLLVGVKLVKYWLQNDNFSAN
jgi:hypothetical protein